MSSPVTVELNLLDNVYKLACMPEEKDFLKHAGNLLQQRFRQMRHEHPQMERQKMAVMLSLQLMQEILSLNSTLQEYNNAQRIIRGMLLELDDAHKELDSL